MEVQRASKAKLHRLVNEINLLVPVAKQVQKLAQQHRTVREGIQVIQHLLAGPVLRRLPPDGYIEHLEHPLFQLTQCCKVHIVQTRQQVKQKIDPPSRIHDGQPRKGSCKRFFQRFTEIRNDIGTNANS